MICRVCRKKIKRGWYILKNNDKKIKRCFHVNIQEGIYDHILLDQNNKAKMFYHNMI